MTLRGLKVLVADDDETARLLIGSMLADSGVEAQAVPSGEDAVGALRNAPAGHPFDAAILDCRMPGMDGGNVALVVGADPTIPPVRLILLSSATQLGWAHAARPTGIRGYLSKPVSQVQLRECLKTVMGHKDYEPGDKSGPLGATQSLDPEAIRVIKALDRRSASGVFRRVVELYISKAHLDVNEIRAAVCSRTAVEAADAAHGLKGSSATIGAVVMAAKCAGIEDHIKAVDWPGARSMLPGLADELERVSELLTLELEDDLHKI